MPATPDRRHLLRLLGRSADADLPAAPLRAAVCEQAEHIAAGLVDEALSNDDVTSAAAARAFVAERLAEFDDLIDPDVRGRIGALATAEIGRRAPDP